jgi:predicted MFS family arabinose efflux permease
VVEAFRPTTELIETPVPTPSAGRPAKMAWTTAVLAIVAFLAAIDRQSFAVLLVPIQKDLGVSDAAMGC